MTQLESAKFFLKALEDNAEQMAQNEYNAYIRIGFSQSEANEARRKMREAAMNSPNAVEARYEVKRLQGHL
jgi:hypothetical protein